MLVAYTYQMRKSCFFKAVSRIYLKLGELSTRLQRSIINLAYQYIKKYHFDYGLWKALWLPKMLVAALLRHFSQSSSKSGKCRANSPTCFGLPCVRDGHQDPHMDTIQMQVVAPNERRRRSRRSS